MESIIKNDQNAFHLVELYSGKNKAPAGKHLHIISWKVTEKQKKADANYTAPAPRCVAVPLISVSVTPQALQTALQDAAIELQKELVRSLIEDHLASATPTALLSLHDSQLDAEAIQNYAVANAKTGKINKDLIAQWFDDDLADNLTVRICDAMKVTLESSAAEQAKVADAVTKYRTHLLTFAAPTTKVSPATAEQLSKVLALVDEAKQDNRVFKAISTKISAARIERDPEFVGI